MTRRPGLGPRAAALTAALALALSAGRALADGHRPGPREGARAKPEATPLVEQRLEPPRLAVVGGDIHPVTSPPIPGGTVLLERGRIKALLPAGGPVPQGFEVLHAEGWRVYPGLVAAGAPFLGISGDAFGEKPGSGKPKLLGPAFDAWADEVELAASGGVTTAVVSVTSFAAGESQAPLAGRAAAFKMSYGEPRGALALEPAALLASRAVLGPGGRFRFDELVSQVRRAARERELSPEEKELLALLDRKLPLVVAGDSAASVLAAMDLAKAHRLRVVLYQPTEAWPLASELAEAGLSVVQHVRGSWGKNRDDRRTAMPGGWRFDAPARLAAAGVVTAVVPYADSVSTWGVAGQDLRDLALEAAFAQRGGLTPQQAIEAVTIIPARMFGLEARVGSLERGKDADVVIADGDLLDYRTLVRVTIVNGRVAYELEGNRWWKWVGERRDAELARTGARRPQAAAPPSSPASGAAPAREPADAAPGSSAPRP